MLCIAYCVGAFVFLMQKSYRSFLMISSNCYLALFHFIEIHLPYYRVWSVRYNHFHDQLVLSSSSDSRVILNNVVSLSSEPFGHLVESEENSDSENNER